jgi:PEP-CTERM motif
VLTCDPSTNPCPSAFPEEFGRFQAVGAVPEPGSLSMLGVGLASLVGVAWARRKARAKIR